MPQPREGELVLDRYRLATLLGSGASAEVWLATDERLGRQVALKILHPHLLLDPATRERFLAEARSVAGLRHPGIVGIHDVVAGGSFAAIVFEHVPGESLEARLRRDPPPSAEEAASIAAQVAEALAAAHRAGIVHRDVKPANILLASPAGTARLVDFGIARALEPAHARLTRAGEIVGSLSSMAPEQLAGDDVGPAADVYGLGAVLYELLAGRPPFEGSTPLAVADRQRRPPPPIPGAPRPLVDLAVRMLRRVPEERPSSAPEVAAFLRGWLDAHLEPAHGLPPSFRFPAAAGPSDPTLAGGPRDPLADLGRGPTRSRRRFLALPLAGAGVVAVAVLALAFQTILPVLARPSSPPAIIAASPTPGRAGSAAGSNSPSESPSESPSPSPTESPSPVPTPSPSPTPVPVPTALSILSPADGSITAQRRISVEGEAPPNALVTRDIAFFPDDHVTADAAGHWSLSVDLAPGPNTLIFRLGDDRATDQVIHVSYEP